MSPSGGCEYMSLLEWNLRSFAVTARLRFSAAACPRMQRRAGRRGLLAGVNGRLCLRRHGIGIFPAGPDVHRVVRVLVDEPERGVVDIAAAEIAEIIEAEDLLDVLGRGVVVLDVLVDGLVVGILGRIAQRIPQRVRGQQRPDERLPVGVVRSRGQVLVADLGDHVAEELVLRDEVHARLGHRAERLGLRRRRLGIELAEQRLDRFGPQKCLERPRNDPAFVRVVRLVLRHRPVPVRDRDVLLEVLQVLLELVEVGAVPGEEALPAVLAVVLVDQRLVVVVAPVLLALVEIVDLAERVAQPVDLGLAQAIEILALARLALAVGVTPRARVADVKLGEIDDLRGPHVA